ncbi:MAG TPA: TMEM175 family protein [Bauldia sp.]|nr:TMEM175 family protein [Bauldia sp.]
MERNNERLIFFSDAVIAVAVTLLVLDIRLPVEHAGGLSNAELWAAVVETLPRIYAYALSFLVVSLFWNSHHQKFNLIPRVNGIITALNVAFLLSIGLVPFVTSVIAENGDTVATAMYAALMTALGATLMAIWAYAAATGRVRDDVDTHRRRRIFWLSVGTFVVFLVSIPLAFVNADAAKYFWLLLIPLSLARYATHSRDKTVEESE